MNMRPALATFVFLAATGILQGHALATFLCCLTLQPRIQAALIGLPDVHAVAIADDITFIGRGHDPNLFEAYNRLDTADCRAAVDGFPRSREAAGAPRCDHAGGLALAGGGRLRLRDV